MGKISVRIVKGRGICYTKELLRNNLEESAYLTAFCFKEQIIFTQFLIKIGTGREGKGIMPEKNRAEVTYRIGELSRLTGVKAGTIRFYEKCGFMGGVERTSNNYRIYQECHVFRVRVCRLVFGGFVNSRLRKASLKVLDASARWDAAAYERESARYLRAVEEDIERTRRAIAICTGQMCREKGQEAQYSKKQAAAMIGATPEAIRNWERNGLLGRYEPYQRRSYGQTLLDRMFVIRLLLDIGYSMMAVREFLLAYEEGGPEEAQQVLISPKEGGELYCRSDRYLEALMHLREKALCIEKMKSEMEEISS